MSRLPIWQRGNYNMIEKVTQLQLENMSFVKINQSYCENQNKASKVQRRLFGEIKNKEERDVKLQEMIQIIHEKNTKWNFNFLTCEPQNGRYVWTKIYAENEKENLTTSRSKKRVVKRKSSRKPVNNRRKTKDKEVNDQKKITGKKQFNSFKIHVIQENNFFKDLIGNYYLMCRHLNENMQMEYFIHSFY